MVDKILEEQLGTIVVMLAQTTVQSKKFDLPYESPPPLSILNASIKPDRLSSYVGGQNLSTATRVPQETVALKPNTLPYQVTFQYFTRKMLMAMNVIPNPKSTPLLKTIAETFEHITPSLLKAMSVELEKKYPEDPAHAPAEAKDVIDDDWSEISEDLSLTIKDALSKRFK